MKDIATIESGRRGALVEYGIQASLYIEFFKRQRQEREKTSSENASEKTKNVFILSVLE